MLNTPYEICQMVVGMLGSLLTIVCFIPQGLKTLKTKDTSGISIIFPIAALISSFFWISGGVLAIVHPFVFNGNGSSVANGLVTGIPIILTNLVTSIVNVTITVIKLKNMSNAKKLNISEEEYCHNKNNTNS